MKEKQNLTKGRFSRFLSETVVLKLLDAIYGTMVHNFTFTTGVSWPTRLL